MANIMRIGGGGGSKGGEVIVNTDAGATVTATTTGTTITAVADAEGIAELKLSKVGTWTIQASKDGLVGPAKIYTVPPVFFLPVVAVANTAPTGGVTYKEGLEGVTPELMHVYGEAISNNNSINNTTNAVWLNCGAESRKISIGDTMPLSINGSEWAVQVISFNTDDMADPGEYRSTKTGKCGMTLDTVLSIADARMNPTNTNSGGWANTEMRNTTISAMLATIPTEWQEVMLTRKLANNLGTTPTLDKLALHSQAGVTVTGAVAYRLYGRGGSAPFIKKNASGNAVYWWLRDAYTGNSSYFYDVSTSGSLNYDIASYLRGVSPGFAF